MTAGAQKRILVVEDDNDVRFLVAEELEQHGYAVVEARNGLEALDAVAKEWPSAILLDMRMPLMDGWHFVRELRKRYGRVAPLVVMTAAANASERAREVDANDWLAKPFELDAVVETVERVLKKAIRGQPSAEASAPQTER